MVLLGLLKTLCPCSFVRLESPAMSEVTCEIGPPELTRFGDQNDKKIGMAVYDCDY